MGASAQPAHDFLSFVDGSPTPYHAVHSVKERLNQAGFRKLLEREDWSTVCEPGGKYYVTRNASSIIAFAIGQEWRPGNPIAMIGAHTDSPCLRVKPVSKNQAEGFLQVGVECYGGALFHTWFDRDLSVAGRVMVRSPQEEFVQKLVNIKRPILRIPTLAIHLDRQEKFEFNKETQLFPIAGLVAAELNRHGKNEGTTNKDVVANNTGDSFSPLPRAKERHHPHLIELLAEETGTNNVEDVIDFELVLYDCQKSCIGGLNNEFLFSARLDNLGMTYCSVMGLVQSVQSPTSLINESCIRLMSLFDHEEVGSTSAQGAGSNFLPSIIGRLSVIPSSGKHQSSSTTAYERTLSNSFLISADMAHSIHPNYAAKYESNHRPEMNKGPVIKINANQRYATNAPGIVLVQEIARRAKVPLQLFVVSNSSSCGSTVGPMLAASTGIRTLDLGNPILSMHSIRETGGVYDVDFGISLFESFFVHFSDLGDKILVN